MFVVEFVAFVISEITDLFRKPKTIDQMTEDEYEMFWESHMGFPYNRKGRDEQ